jgi:hypothetical protein
MKKLTDKQKVKIYEKEGYFISRKYGSTGPYEVCFSLDLFDKRQKLINTYFLHITECCPKCRKKILKKRKIK